MPNATKLVIDTGMICNQGRMLEVTAPHTVNIRAGTVGSIRYDVVVAHFQTDGTNEVHDIRVLENVGTTSGGSFMGSDVLIPNLPQQNNLFNGDTSNDYPLFSIRINGSEAILTTEFDIVSYQSMLSSLQDRLASTSELAEETAFNFNLFKENIVPNIHYANTSAQEVPANGVKTFTATIPSDVISITSFGLENATVGGVAGAGESNCYVYKIIIDGTTARFSVKNTHASSVARVHVLFSYLQRGV